MAELQVQVERCVELENGTELVVERDGGVYLRWVERDEMGYVIQRHRLPCNPLQLKEAWDLINNGQEAADG